MPQTIEIKIGDLFVSSNLSSNYPRGYPVGVVVAVRHDTGVAFSEIVLAPKAYLHHNRYVLLVWPSPAKQET